MAALAVMAAGAQGAVIFTEDFGTLADGTEISTSNTDLTYVRVGTGGGSILAENPSSFGSGASAFITGPTSTSLNGIGVQSTLDFGSASSLSFSADFSLSDASGNIVFGLGSGTSFTGNVGFSTTQGLFWLQVNGTNFERRTSSAWTDIGGGTTLALNTNYSLLVEVDVVAGLMDISLNGTLLDNDVAVTTAAITNPTGFRIYSTNGSDVEIDNILLTAVPEPTAAMLLAGAGAMFWVSRRKRSVRSN